MATNAPEHEHVENQIDDEPGGKSSRCHGRGARAGCPPRRQPPRTSPWRAWPLPLDALGVGGRPAGAEHREGEHDHDHERGHQREQQVASPLNSPTASPNPNTMIARPSTAVLRNMSRNWRSAICSLGMPRRCSIHAPTPMLPKDAPARDHHAAAELGPGQPRGHVPAAPFLLEQLVRIDDATPRDDEARLRQSLDNHRHDHPLPADRLQAVERLLQPGDELKDEDCPHEERDQLQQPLGEMGARVAQHRTARSRSSRR